jgi:hypothetical protein
MAVEASGFLWVNIKPETYILSASSSVKYDCRKEEILSCI